MLHASKIAGCALIVAAFSLAGAKPPVPKPKIVEVHRIWSQAPHNAFTDLIRYKNRWYCVFREGSGHASPDGAIRVLTSTDGAAWTAAALVTTQYGDLRDPKLAITPDSRLMLTAVEAYPEREWVRHQTYAWFSYDGRSWGSRVKIGDPNMWLWRVTWHNRRAYSVGYSTVREHFTRLYTAPDGQAFAPHGEVLFDQGFPNEASLLFQNNGAGLCLLRRDDGDPKEAAAMLGSSRPPYRGWSWKSLGVRVGGPNMIRLPDDRVVVAGRLYDQRQRTALCWLDAEEGALDEFLVLPSAGDSSYPGLVYFDDLLWISYYSSHEGKTSIYLAKVKIPPAS
jgi:hypothetical protein